MQIEMFQKAIKECQKNHQHPYIHLKMLDKSFDWHTAQMPINVMDAHYRSFRHEVVPVCLEKGVGVLGVKSLGGGRQSAIIPSEAGVSAEPCIRYAFSQPISTLVVGMKLTSSSRPGIAAYVSD